ncbi:MAG: hypothetical protein EOM59_00680 [Clostridia bacterium]|nr:hypothetical protein [Clostridia bacterium]
MAQHHTGRSILQLISACAVIGIAVFFVGREFWLCSDCYYLGGYDAVPVFTKTKYIVECLHQGQIPSWFPYWYCGSAVYQYYPPLVYIITSVIEFLANSTNLTLKIYMISTYFIGGLGVWAICRKYLHSVTGILAAILYIFSPYIVATFFGWGNVSQMPIVALAPWYIFACVSFCNTGKRSSWLAIVLLIFILCISHVMHGFMIALSVFISLFISTLIDSKKTGHLFFWTLGTAVGVGLLSFWWLVGVFPLELQSVPYLDPSAAEGYTASLAWFFPTLSDWFESISPGLGVNLIGAYFPPLMLLFSIFAMFKIRNESDSKRVLLRLLFINTIFTAVFSLGYHLPFFKWIPFSEQLVPGRILTQTAIGTSILSAYFLVQVFKLFQKKAFLKNLSVFLLVAFLLSSIVESYKYYPTSQIRPTSDSDIYKAIDSDLTFFNKGRMTVVDTYHPINSYYSYVFGLNNTLGWNIEGTSQSDYVQFQLTALDYKKYQYIFKSMNDMNVQYILLNKRYDQTFGKFLSSRAFLKISETDGISLYFREGNTYFYEQIRDCIIVGMNVEAFLFEFPWFVDGWSESINDYSFEDFLDFQTVYFYEPQIKTQSSQAYFEALLIKLVNAGKNVYVELGNSDFKSTKSFGVYNTIINLSGKQSLKNQVEGTSEYYYTDPYREKIYALKGMDETIFSFETAQEKTPVVLVGRKLVGNGYVTFIGGPLTAQKSLTKEYYGGEDISNPSYVERDEVIYSVFEYLFSNTEQYTDLALPAFPVTHTEWGIDQFEFSYVSETEKKVMISVTYTPRWHAYLGEQELEIISTDKMLTLVLPAGENTVHMKYIPTAYAKVGVYMSYVSAALILVILLFFRQIKAWFTAFIRRAADWLEIPNRENEPNDTTKIDKFQ